MGYFGSVGYFGYYTAIINVFTLVQIECFTVYVMQMKSFLRRRHFIATNILYILINLCLVVNTVLIAKYNLLVKVAIGGFSMLVAGLVFFLCIYRLSIENMLYATYIGILNITVLSINFFFSFLVYFKSDSPYAIIFEEIPVFAVSGISLVYSFYIACIRKCMVDGLVYPVFIQRRKKIESRVVLVRREYPEIFSVQ